MFRRSSLAQDQAFAASATLTEDLGVNPLSHLVITFRALNVTDEATLAELLARFGTITVSRFGETIFNMTAADLHKHNAIMFGNLPILLNQVATDNATRALTLIVPFARRLYDKAEGLPKTQRGELQVQVTAGSADTACDNATLQIEQVEMLDANPSRFLKITSLSQTMTSGVDNDVSLPIGNDIVSILVYSTTVPTGTAFTTTADKLRVLVDNIETGYANAQWESLHGELIRKIGHTQAYDASADVADVDHYALLDFSPNGGDEHLLKTGGKSQVTMKVTAGDGNAIRALIAELAKN